MPRVHGWGSKVPPGSQIPGHGLGLSSFFHLLCERKKNIHKKYFALLLHTPRGINLPTYHTQAKLFRTQKILSVASLSRFLFGSSPSLLAWKELLLLNVVVNLENHFFYLFWFWLTLYLSFNPLAPHAPSPNPAPLRLLQFDYDFRWPIFDVVRNWKLKKKPHSKRIHPHTSPWTT